MTVQLLQTATSATFLKKNVETKFPFSSNNFCTYSEHQCSADSTDVCVCPGNNYAHVQIVQKLEILEWLFKYA